MRSKLHSIAIGAPSAPPSSMTWPRPRGTVRRRLNPRGIRAGPHAEPADVDDMDGAGEEAGRLAAQNGQFDYGQLMQMTAGQLVFK